MHELLRVNHPSILATCGVHMMTNADTSYIWRTCEAVRLPERSTGNHKNDTPNFLLTQSFTHILLLMSDSPLPQFERSMVHVEVKFLFNSGTLAL